MKELRHFPPAIFSLYLYLLYLSPCYTFAGLLKVMPQLRNTSELHATGVFSQFPEQKNHDKEEESINL